MCVSLISIYTPFSSVLEQLVVGNTYWKISKEGVEWVAVSQDRVKGVREKREVKCFEQG